MMQHDFTAASGPETARSRLRAPSPAAVPTSEVIAILRHAGAKLGLGPQVLRSLEILLSCLPPHRNHHMVFASNETLVLRAQGLHERSLRRHIAALRSVGLLERCDSANRKRYTCHDPVAGQMLRFGLDLSPLFARIAELRALAETAKAEAQQLSYLKRKLRVAAQRVLMLEPLNPLAREAANAARRQLSVAELQQRLAALPELSEAAELPETTALPALTQEVSDDMTDSDGHYVRHLPNFSKELIDKNEPQPEVGEILTSHAEALSYAPTVLSTQHDIEDHARVLAPMLGISSSLYQEACQARGAWTIASLIWMITQEAARIARPAAYFRVLALGDKAASYRPWHWLIQLRRRLSADNHHSHHCPRTIPC